MAERGTEREAEVTEIGLSGSGKFCRSRSAGLPGGSGHSQQNRTHHWIIFTIFLIQLTLRELRHVSVSRLCNKKVDIYLTTLNRKSGMFH